MNRVNQVKQTTCPATSPEILKPGAHHRLPLWIVIKVSLAGNQQGSVAPGAGAHPFVVNFCTSLRLMWPV